MIEFNKHANVIYKDAGEKNVGSVVLKTDAGNYLYWDNYETPVKKDELLDLILKDLVWIETSDISGIHKVTGYELSDDNISVFIAKDSVYTCKPQTI